MRSLCVSRASQPRDMGCTWTSTAYGAGTPPKKHRLNLDSVTMPTSIRTQKKGERCDRTAIGNSSRAKTRIGSSTSSSLARSHRRDETFGSSRAKSVLRRGLARSITVRRWMTRVRVGGNEMAMALIRTKKIVDFRLTYPWPVTPSHDVKNSVEKYPP